MKTIKNRFIKFKMHHLAIAALVVASISTLSAVMDTVSAAEPKYTITDLGKLDGYASTGRLVNDSGKVAGTVSIGDSYYTFVTNSEGEMIDLGTLGGSRIGSNSVAINKSGEVVGGSRYDDTYSHAFVTDNNNDLIDLGTLGGTYSVARSINDSGQIVGNSSTSSGETHAFVIDSEGTMIDLGTLGGTESGAKAINNSGKITGSGKDAYGNTHAFVTDNDNNLIDLGTLGGAYSTPNAINDSGKVIGMSYATGAGVIKQHAFVTDNDNNLIDLGTLGGDHSFAIAINESGQILGHSRTSDGELHVFITDSDNNLIDLGTLGGTLGLAKAINNSGQGVGYSYTPDGKKHAFITDNESAMIELSGLVHNLSDEWDYLRVALDISNTGYITGDGYTIDGELHAFLLTPITEVTTPIITSGPTITSITDTSAIVTWETNIPATSVVNYGLTDPAENSSSSDTLTTEHSVTLTGLDDNMLYYVNVKSIDENNNSSETSSTISFTTLEDTTPPVFTYVPEDVVIRANKRLNIVDFGTATATDIFEPVTITNDAPVEGFPRKSTTTVTWTATDANGNTATATQEVTLTNKK